MTPTFQLFLSMSEHPLNNPMLVAAGLIDRVLAGELPPDVAIDAWPDSGTGERVLLNETWTALQHFADDGDIHETDADYLEAERCKLEGCASRLRERMRAISD